MRRHVRAGLPRRAARQVATADCIAGQVRGYSRELILHKTPLAAERDLCSMRSGHLIFTAAAALALLVPLLSVVPRLLPPDPDLPNVAARLGFAAELVFPLIVLWLALTVGAAALLSGAARGGAEPAPEGPRTAGPEPLRAWAERLAVALPAVLLGSPPGLARFGPHVEDAYFLTALWRMTCGDAPWRDFEFVYGPLSLIPVHLWMQAAGFSMMAYYAFLLLTQAAFWVMLVAILQRRVPEPGRRLLAILVLFPLLFDILLGLNWIAWRYFAAPLAILLLAGAPRSLARAAGAGALAGLGLAMSWEYGVAGLAALLAMQAVLLAEPGPAGVLLRTAVMVATAAAAAAATILLATGGAPGSWLESLATVAGTARALGLGQFAFGWTLETLALFGLLALFATAAGAALRHRGREGASAGDLELVGAGAFLVVALRIALQRADSIHLIVPFVPLLLVLVAGRPARLLGLPHPARRVALVLACVAAASHAIGQLPLGLDVARGSLRGTVHALQGRPTAAETLPAGFRGTERERSRAAPDVAALAARLAAPDLAGRPVLFYGSAWPLAVRTGTCPAGHSFYDLIYSDRQAPLAATVAAHPDLVVVLTPADRAALSGPPPGPPPPPPTGLRALAAWTSSVHFVQSKLEGPIEQEMWASAVGRILAAEFRDLDRAGNLMLMDRAQ